MFSWCVTVGLDKTGRRLVTSIDKRAVITVGSGHPKQEKNKMAEGLIADCRMLLSRFENLKTVRFEKFCEVWREMNFSLIHW